MHEEVSTDQGQLRNHSSQGATSPPNHTVPLPVMLKPISLAKNDLLNGAVKTKWSRWDFNLNSLMNLWGTGWRVGWVGDGALGRKNQPWGKDFCRNYCNHLIGLGPTAISNPQQGKLPNCLLKRFCGFSAFFPLLCGYSASLLAVFLVSSAACIHKPEQTHLTAPALSNH